METLTPMLCKLEATVIVLFRNCGNLAKHSHLHDCSCDINLNGSHHQIQTNCVLSKCNVFLGQQGDVHRVFIKFWPLALKVAISDSVRPTQLYFHEMISVGVVKSIKMPELSAVHLMHLAVYSLNY